MANGTTASTDDLDDLLTFPVLTREVGLTAPAAPATPGGGSGGPGAPLALLVDNALRRVLGTAVRRDDPRGIVAALTHSFTCREVEGRRECRWMPRGASSGVQADLGALTGAQASLFSRAVNTRDQALPLLDNLRPLRSDADDEDTASVRALIRSEILELVNELGALGGPRIPRVNQLFRLLLGDEEPLEPPPGVPVAEIVQGHLRLLGDRFGLERSRINTVGEEQVFTDFLTLVDYLSCLLDSWASQRAVFRRDGTLEAYLGTQLVLLSRELEVIAESIQELYFVMDSVFLGPSERDTLVLDLNPESQDMTVTELFDWISRYVSEEAPRTIQVTGRDGVRATRLNLGQLRIILGRAAVAPVFANPRLRRAIEEIRTHLDTAIQLVERLTVSPPQIDRLIPDLAGAGSTVRISLLGQGLAAASEVSLRRAAGNPNVIPGTIADRTETEILIDFVIPAISTSVNPTGVWDIVVRTPVGEDTFRRAFAVTSAFGGDGFIALDSVSGVSVAPPMEGAINVTPVAELPPAEAPDTPPRGRGRKPRKA